MNAAAPRIDPTPDPAGMKVLVVGLGRTGEAAARFLLERGAEVTVTDSRPADELAEAAGPLAAAGAALELGGHRDETFLGADLIVLSPGVPPTIGPMVRARAAGVAVTGEIELASRFVKAPIAAVTGTNGKTTTTSLLGGMFRAAGRSVFVGGNIGNPLIEYVRSGEEAEIVVIEVSSFQLETADRLKPRVGALLNLTPDHLDRYPDFASYREAKYRIFARQTAEDAAVLNADDPDAAAAETAGRRLFFSRRDRQDQGACLENGRIVVRRGGREEGSLPVSALRVTGAHNQENVMAAALCAMDLGVEADTALRAAAAFRGLAHRVELVGEKDGVRYYDDSKGTNVGAVVKSLEGFDGPVVLIAGGRDKAGDFRPLGPLVRDKVKLLILLGEARESLYDAIGHETRTVLVDDMEEAVNLAGRQAEPGDAVLLSPACASFDQFRDYAHRGEVFTKLVREWIDR